MSDELVIDLSDSKDETVYGLYRDGKLVMSWGEGFHRELMKHPKIKEMHGKPKEVTRND